MSDEVVLLGNNNGVAAEEGWIEADALLYCASSTHGWAVNWVLPGCPSTHIGYHSCLSSCIALLQLCIRPIVAIALVLIMSIMAILLILIVAVLLAVPAASA
jgi:hypothetical protein